MTGALIQLAATGIQDNYLTGNPDITYFKVVYRRHTNFAIESIRQNFSGNVELGDTVTCTLGRHGDMINHIVLYIELPPLVAIGKSKISWARSLGYALINEVYIEIGDTLIDKQYGEWMFIWSELNNRKKALNKMIGNVPEMYEFSSTKPGYHLYVPLDFWFCRNIGNSLPMVALGSLGVKISVKFRDLESCCRIGPTNTIAIQEPVCPFVPGDYVTQTAANKTTLGYVIDYNYLTNELSYLKLTGPGFIGPQDGSTPLIYGYDNNYYVTPVTVEQDMTYPTPSLSLLNSYLLVDYIYLEKMERDKITSGKHDYQIEQIQYTKQQNISNTNIKVKLPFRNPSIELYWVAHLSGRMNDMFNYTSSYIYGQGNNLVKNSELYLSSISRFGKANSDETDLIQSYRYYKNDRVTGINTYSFALYPNDSQQSSTLNMSQVSDPILKITLDPVVNNNNMADVRVYCRSYNIMRVCVGQMVLLF